MALTLVSFKLCPFVQRSIIVLREKQIDFDIRYIDLRKKPQWFLDISPTGKVPLLMVDEEVLFESMAINEYLDEAFAPTLHPVEPLLRARNRAWVEIANQLSASQFGFTMAKDKYSYQQNLEKAARLLEQLEQQLNSGAGPYFNGIEFALIDAAFAPFFTRQGMLEAWFGIGLLNQHPKVRTYGINLQERRSVINSIVADYVEIYGLRLKQEQTWLCQSATN
ncbi:MAG: glutathione S-transferase family protein [Gammaproteobacteria bacterium]|nr:MAG: glutathione S-transferase family protein [Gammaproteobacteria bacterium]RLA14786.1 MAG: glutathione S-transferase family protein [Gammaproteobacteria bacterium]RLA18169.1 MAG: glutathione S-transferase family protein [Gammaproteobacteria bacterium]